MEGLEFRCLFPLDMLSSMKYCLITMGTLLAFKAQSDIIFYVDSSICLDSTSIQYDAPKDTTLASTMFVGIVIRSGTVLSS